MEALVEQHKQGRSVAELSSAIQKAPPERSELATNEADDKATGGSLLERLQALQLAQATGATLTSREARWVLGRKPAEAERIKKVGINAWQLLNG